ncbi:MAG: adenosylcobinamide-phosphate synthase CbiB [Candidatus Binataceae bacterium]
MDAAIFMPAWLILLALLLDVALGDPSWLPHPVRAIGAVIAFGERRLRTGYARLDLRNGALLAVGVIALSVACVWASLALIGVAGWWLSALAGLLVAWTALAARGLDRAAFSVQAALSCDDEARARRALPALVGRDPEALNRNGMICATVESVAENCSDGIIAPLLFLFVGGPVAAMAYKAANTLDSMIGYTNTRYYYFGRTAARIDDVLNYIPARLTALCLIVAAALVSGRARKAYRSCRADARVHRSRNAGYPEAAMAGALGIQLGGDAVYEGEIERRGVMGVREHEPAVTDIVRARRMMWTALTLAFVVLAIARLAFVALIA